MKQLSPKQLELLASLARRLAAIRGIGAVVLGGSHARGRAYQGSDIDLGLFYSEATPFSIESIRELAEDINDTAGPVVTDFYGWGPWVNGGAWLTLGGQRIDFIYRCREHVERVIAEAEADDTNWITRSNRHLAFSVERISGRSRCACRCSILRDGLTI